MEKVKLNILANIFDGIHETPSYKTEGIKFVSVEDIKNLYQSNKFISVNDYDRLYKIKPEKNDVLMTRIGDIGTPAICNTKENLAYYVSLALIKAKEDVSANYLLYAIQSQFFKKELYKRTIHVAFPKKINLSEIGECSIPITTIEEQNKIATFLNLYYKKIELQKRKVKLLNTINKLITKVICNDNEASVYKLCQLCSIKKGSQLNKLDMIESGKYKVYNGGISLSGNTNNFNTNENTVTISEGGNSCGFVNYITEKFWSGGHNYTVHNSQINNLYLYFILKNNQENLMKLRVGSGLPNIQKTSLENFEIKINKNKIDCNLKILQLFNYKIDLEQTKLKLLEKYKQGLLQQMFV